MNMCETTLFTNAANRDDAEMILLFFVEDYCLYNNMEYGIISRTNIIQQETAKMLMLYQQVNIARRLQQMIDMITDSILLGNLSEDPLIPMTSAVHPAFDHNIDMTYYVDPDATEGLSFPIFDVNCSYWYGITIIFNYPENLT